MWFFVVVFLCCCRGFFFFFFFFFFKTVIIISEMLTRNKEGNVLFHDVAYSAHFKILYMASNM